MKYLLAGVLVLIVAFSVFAYKKNQADKERIKQAGIAHQQRLEQEKVAELDKQYGGTAIKEETIQQVVSAKVDDKEASPEQIAELNNMITEWMDAATVAGSTSRIALSQPVAKMQEIKRTLASKSYQGCVEATRLLYVDAMTTNIDSYLEFMKGREYELNALNLTQDYKKQLEMAEKEKAGCKALTA